MGQRACLRWVRLPLSSPSAIPGRLLTAARASDFDDWLVETFARVGAFTMLIVLVEIGESSVALLRSSYLHVIGDETRWPDMARLFGGSGAAWNGAAFLQADRIGVVTHAPPPQR